MTTTTKTIDVEALCARLDKLAESLRANTGPPLSGTHVDVVEARALLHVFADALGYIATTDGCSVEHAKRVQRVAAGARWHSKRPAEVLR